MTNVQTERVVLQQLDKFFHCHEEDFETLRQDGARTEEVNSSRPKHNTYRLSRTVEELSKCLLNTFCDEGVFLGNCLSILEMCIYISLRNLQVIRVFTRVCLLTKEGDALSSVLSILG